MSKEDLLFQPRKAICLGEAEKILGEFVVNALQLNYDALNDWSKAVPITQKEGRPIIQIENRELEQAYRMLELNGIPRERAKNVANGIQVLVTRFVRELQIIEFAYVDALSVVNECAEEGHVGARNLVKKLKGEPQATV